jgi:hypothetical protein
MRDGDRRQGMVRKHGMVQKGGHGSKRGLAENMIALIALTAAWPQLM